MNDARRRAPLIGITCEAVAKGGDFSRYDLVCDHRYAEGVRNAGGHPVLLAIAHRRAILGTYLEGIDGLVIVGGDDVDPAAYGQRSIKTTRPTFPGRAAFESWLYLAGRRRRLPMLAICYGMQLVNVLEGGTLLQHIRRKRDTPKVAHRACQGGEHGVELVKATRLRRLLRSPRIEVATDHHQAIGRLAQGFVAAATADDGIIEAIEHPERSELLAVQWHPEARLQSPATRRLFDAFVRACKEFRRRR